MDLTARIRTLTEASSDEGFTLPELLTAMAMFGLLLVVMSGVMIVGMTNINQVTKRTNVGGSQQNAMEWTSRLVRYTATPNGYDEAIVVAAPFEFSSYTYSGTGEEDGEPYKMRVYVDENRGVMSQIVNPDTTTGELLYTDAPYERVLIPLNEFDMNRPIFTYFDADGNVLEPTSTEGGCTAPDGKTQTCYGRLGTDQMQKVKSVSILFDNSVGFQEVQQTVGLVNIG